MAEEMRGMKWRLTTGSGGEEKAEEEKWRVGVRKWVNIILVAMDEEEGSERQQSGALTMLELQAIPPSPRRHAAVTSEGGVVGRSDGLVEEKRYLGRL